MVTVLVAVIAVANGSSDESATPQARPGVATADSGTGHDRAGAQDAATRIAKRLGSTEMFGESSRRTLYEEIAAPTRIDTLLQEADEDYGPFTEKIGLDEEGTPPKGQRLVSKSTIKRATVTAYQPDRAVVDVRCSGTFGIDGTGSKVPVDTGTFTMTITLLWTSDGWKLSKAAQDE
ncbi:MULTISPECIES: hypothetical protein [unclassified Streptomyces]|uniref:hypothetical protein n=1 Tax=unclassified Streptomyces TaxID=2593676 RepID=UPI00278C0695|nr:MULTISPECIES: hypothetical protein [unclassified Streptomyces]